jgi:dTDP-4-amino-4,6-dideoxygalactose transaminase
MDCAEEKAVIKVLRSGWITKGPETERFENNFATYIGVSHAIGLNSCTAGLHLSLIALGIGPGDEVITSPLTFAATANVIVHCGARVVFADIDPVSGNISFSEFKKKITHKTKAVIVVHLAGYPSDMDEIIRFCRTKGIHVIEDAAHALGASLKGKKIGAWGVLTSFSFYASKNITTGEGGMVTTDNRRLANKIRTLSLHGLSLDAWKRYTPTGRLYYTVDCAGYKYNMFDIQAALGNVQLKKLNEFQKKREVLWDRYTKNLQDVNELVLPALPRDGVHAMHLYIVVLKTKARGDVRATFMEGLRAKGIATQVHFLSLHLHPFYKKMFGFKALDFPQAYMRSQQCVSLPLYPQLTIQDIDYISKQIRALVCTKRRA